jgi:hypothetical protein
MGQMKYSYNNLVDKFEGKISLGRPRHRWMHNITTALLQISSFKGHGLVSAF